MNDPKKPYKMYAGIASAFLTSIVTDATLDLPRWVAAIISAAVAGLAIYMTPNPTVSETQPGLRLDENG
jgi:hypothetical protein